MENLDLLYRYAVIVLPPRTGSNNNDSITEVKSRALPSQTSGSLQMWTVMLCHQFRDQREVASYSNPFIQIFCCRSTLITHSNSIIVKMEEKTSTPPSSLQNRQQCLILGESMRALEVGALAIGEQDEVRSIGRRLGGHFEASSIRTSVVLSDADRLELAGAPNERTRLLLASKRRSSAAMILEQTLPPKLIVWIIPALVCAAAYAFYNVLIKKGSALVHPILGGVILSIQYWEASFSNMLPLYLRPYC